MPLIVTTRVMNSGPRVAARDPAKDVAMSIKMKAMKDFRGKPGEATGKMDRQVEGGGEFNVQGQGRADYLEREGLAYPLVKMESKPLNKMEPAPQNKAKPAARVRLTDPDPAGKLIAQNEASQSGPLPLAGGRTGAQSDFASLSVPDQAQQGPASRRRRGTRES